MSHDSIEPWATWVFLPAFPWSSKGKESISFWTAPEKSSLFEGAINYYSYSETPAEITDLGKTVCGRISEVLPPREGSTEGFIEQGSSLLPGQAHLGIVSGISTLTRAEESQGTVLSSHRDGAGVFLAARTLNKPQGKTDVAFFQTLFPLNADSVL